MFRRPRQAALCGALLLALPVPQALAHAVAGARVFVNTDLIDDPGVGDEANLPLISVQSPDANSTATTANFEFDKTITPHLGFGIGDDLNWITHDANDGNKTHGGLGDLYTQLKYNWITLPQHEFMSSVQVSQAFGRTGTTGFESGYDTTTVSGYFGKGFGDIPWAPIRPFAITGELDYSIPNTGPSAGGGITTWSGGLSLQYSIPYLQAQVKDIGLRGVLAQLTPLAELSWSSAAGSTALPGFSQPTSYLLGTGAVWTGTDYAVSAEVLWPLNGAAGHTIGAIAQLHLYFDDLLPNTLGKPISEW
ncbi:MAG: hypothetical protein KGL12_16855 [Rhodospirillales bacterium]|nr:hypothetical protein [Rhodospirillales bacterium]